VTKMLDRMLVDDFLNHHLAFRPVDATFMGFGGYDAVLPRADASAMADEARALKALAVRIAAQPEPADLGERIDLRLMRAEVAIAQASLEGRPRYYNPAWYTGEAAFGIIGLLLPQADPVPRDAMDARLSAIPDFLADGRARLAGASAPRGWSDRARREAVAFGAFLRSGLLRHAAWDERWAAPAERAACALDDFAGMVSSLEDRNPSSGSAHLSLLMREAHGLALSPDAAIRLASEAFDRMGEELRQMAARIDPNRGWQEQIEAISDIQPAADGVVAEYRYWHDRALADARDLVTPAEYDLDFRLMAPAFQGVASDLYFLFYRSPPAQRPGRGSVYWISAAGADQAAYLRGQSRAMIKTIHSVHHGSVGHHTQNARARAAQSRLARLGGTDCASGISFLSAGTMVEGWACYAEDLMMEAPGFYTDAEILLLKQFERRNAASVLVDSRLHTGEWSLAEAARFYREEAGFSPARVPNEIVRNSMFPGTRLMYWLGVEAIKELRAGWHGTTRAFHDTLLGYGHVPVKWAGDEMARAGMIDA
jgi:Bacterial protein of unknown function (DUF885)